MAKASARPREGRPGPASARGTIKVGSPPPALTRELHELPDGRYLLAYGHAARDAEA